MKVVGIVHNSQNLFCDIYTLPQDDYEEVIMYCDSLYDSPQSLVPFHDSYYIEENANVYGYNHNEAWNDFYTISANLGVFFTGGSSNRSIINCFDDNAFKKTRQRICITKRNWNDNQTTFSMEMYEIALCSVLSILSATLLAPLLSYFDCLLYILITGMFYLCIFITYLSLLYFHFIFKCSLFLYLSC